MRASSGHRDAGRAIPAMALVVAIALLSVAVAATAAGHGRKQNSLERALAAEAREQANELDDYFQRARALTLVTANNPAYREFYELPGSRAERIEDYSAVVENAEQGLVYLQQLFPDSVGEACFIDRGGAENARSVRGAIEPFTNLSTDETEASFFKPTLELREGEVYQARPYRSPDTGEWVLSNSAPVPVRFEDAPAMIHFEITLESFRRQAADTSGRFDVAIVEGTTGNVIADSRYPQRAGDVPLGRPQDRRFVRYLSTAGTAFRQGTADFDGRPSAFRTLDSTPNNPNNWVVVAVARAPRSSWIGSLGLAELSMIALAAFLLGFAVLSFRSAQSQLHSAALTDPLTGLRNRRRLVADLDRLVPQATPERPLVLGLFDLDGFKAYNDSFGHPAGDALLVRLSARLGARMSERASAYRMGGDEFCVLARVEPGEVDVLMDTSSRALSEHGEGFAVTASHGSVVMPFEADEPSEALRLADQRMYSAKSTSRTSAGRQTTDVLMRVLAERDPDLGEHLDDVTALCGAMADAFDLPEQERTALLQAAALHDIGKAAVPDAILSKPWPLNDEEWAFMRQHTIVGERILGAAPSQARAAQLVRSSHERHDGGGYPDGLAGNDIPLGARIIAVCDAFDAMTSSRAYRPTPMSAEGALAELRNCSGTQFDPRVVDVFCRVATERPAREAPRPVI